MDEDMIQKPFLVSVAVFCLTVLVFMWTSVPVLTNLTIYLGVAAAVVSAVLVFTGKEKRYLRMGVHTLLVLAAVGATGWTASPLLVLLYLWAVYLGIFYAPAVAGSFLLSLLFVMLFSAGQAGPLFYMVTILALLLVLPLTGYWRWQRAKKTSRHTPKM